MKTKFLTIIYFLFFSITTFSQKSEIKSAENEFKNGRFQQAISILNSAEYLIFNAEEADQSEFFNLKAKVLTGLVETNIEPSKNISLAIVAYQDLIAAEKASGKFKYSVLALEAIKKIKDDLLASAIADVKAKRFSEGAIKMHTIYMGNIKDTMNLYYAASYYKDAKDYNNAIKLYEKLDILKFSGKGLGYFAVNKKTGEDELFSSVLSRDLSVKNGTHVKPRMEKLPSKKVEIYTNMAFIYLEKGDLDKSEWCNNKILEIDPKNPDAYLNLAYLKIDAKKAVMDEMSNLGTSAKDMKAYDELIIKKDNLVKKAISYLEKGNVAIPSDQDISKLLLNLYRSLDMTTEYNALKARI
jgi:tetratricopeptide (TPR) repeat protein